MNQPTTARSVLRGDRVGLLVVNRNHESARRMDAGEADGARSLPAKRAEGMGEDPDRRLGPFLEPSDDGEEVGAVSVDGRRALELAGFEFDLVRDGTKVRLHLEEAAEVVDRVGSDVAQTAEVPKVDSIEAL